MTNKQQNALFLLFVAVVAAGGFWLARRGEAPGGLLSAVPRDAFLVVTIDVEALRKSPLAPSLLGGDATKLLGAGDISATCGFDPIGRAKEIAIAVPEGGDQGDFGVVAMGDLHEAELAECGKKLMAARGGTSKRSTRGSFTLLEDTAEGGARPKIALREGGPLIVGRGAWLDAMLDAAEGKAPNVLAGSPHMKLRDALAKRDAKPRAVIATAVLPKSLRERLKHEMGAEVDADGGANVAMGGVLSVEIAGVAITAGAAGQESEAAAELRCETADACEEVKKLILRKRLTFSKDVGVRLVGLGPLIDSLDVVTSGTTLTASAHAPTEDIAKAIDRVLRLRNERPRPPPPPSASAAGSH